MSEDDGSDCGLGAWSDDEQLQPPEPSAAPPVPAPRPPTAAALIHGTHDLPPACQAVLRRTASALEASITALPPPPPLPGDPQRPPSSSLPERPRTRAQADESDFVSYVYRETGSADFYKPSGSGASQPDVLSLDADGNPPKPTPAQAPARQQRSSSTALSKGPGGLRTADLARQASLNQRLSVSSSTAAARTDLCALPTITFPLAAGLSSLSRRGSSSATRRSSRAQELAQGDASAGDPSSSVAPAAVSDLDVVRQILLQRRPDMLQDLEAALEGSMLGDQE